MNANEYLQRSTLYRKLIHGPNGEFSRVYAAKIGDCQDFRVRASLFIRF